jgi:hypothetical protein
MLLWEAPPACQGLVWARQEMPSWSVAVEGWWCGQGALATRGIKVTPIPGIDKGGGRWR